MPGFIPMPEEPPKFKPRIPTEFMKGMSPAEQKIIQELDVLHQLNEYQSRVMSLHGEQMSRVEQQTIKTNGRVTVLEAVTASNVANLSNISRLRKNVVWFFSMLGGGAIYILSKFADKLIGG